MEDIVLRHSAYLENIWNCRNYAFLILAFFLPGTCHHLSPTPQSHGKSRFSARRQRSLFARSLGQD